MRYLMVNTDRHDDWHDSPTANSSDYRVFFNP